MPGLKGLKVGDSIMVPQEGGRREATTYKQAVVTKVGRRWLYVGDSRFDIDDGRREEWNGNAGPRAYGLQDYAERELRTVALGRMKEAGFVPEWNHGYVLNRLSLDQLNRIADILEEA